MPTNLSRYPTPAAREQQLRRRRELVQQATQAARPPYLGYCPDLPSHLGPWVSARECRNIVQYSREAAGYFLCHEDGFTRYDPGAAIVARAITGLFTYRNFNDNLDWLYVTAGDGAGTDITLYRIDESNVRSAVAKDAAVTVDPEGSREALWDFAVFPSGVPTRDYGALNGLGVPVLILCNANGDGPVDPVLMTPGEAGGGADLTVYSELWESTFPAALSIPSPLAHPFRATSCEAFRDRMHFLDVQEGGTRYRNRLRYSGVGTADPSNEQIGSGRIDFHDFDRGLRVESLDRLLALYFNNGVQFLTPTGNFLSPYAKGYSTKVRGALSTFGITPISASAHFCIMNDGWWLLDVSGRWTPIGTFDLRESASGQFVLHKFRDTFYRLFDMENRHRLAVTWDALRRVVRVAWPMRGRTTLEVWTYHVDTDSVWPLDTTGLDVTQWGQVDRLIRTATTWADLEAAGTTWEDLSTTTWADLNAEFGLKATTHGSAAGEVYLWDPTVATRDGVVPTGFFESHVQTVTEGDLYGRQTPAHLTVEYMDVEGPGVSMEFVADGGRVSKVATKALTEPGRRGQVDSVRAFFRDGIEGTHHAVRLSMGAPFAIRGYQPRFEITGVDDR